MISTEVIWCAAQRWPGASAPPSVRRQLLLVLPPSLLRSARSHPQTPALAASQLTSPLCCLQDTAYTAGPFTSCWLRPRYSHVIGSQIPDTKDLCPGGLVDACKAHMLVPNMWPPRQHLCHDKTTAQVVDALVLGHPLGGRHAAHQARLHQRLQPGSALPALHLWLGAQQRLPKLSHLQS